MVVVIVPHRNTVQEEDLMKQATQPSVSAQEIKLILILNVPQKISKTDTKPSIHPYTLPVSHTYTIHPSIHPSIHLTYHKNCISNLHYLSFHPSIHTSDLPQHYLKLILIHPSTLPVSQTYTILPSTHPYI